MTQSRSGFILHLDGLLFAAKWLKHAPDARALCNLSEIQAFGPGVLQIGAFEAAGA